MNVFKRSKKPKDKENVDPFGQMAASEPASSKVSRSLKRKNKGAPEPKPEFNLAAALPNTNDFRTSLLMPGLSARFSMLKEQDDPNSLLGKASDDSVLFPKRASRMNVFGNNPLADIAETESLHSIPKPFARDERTMSMSEGGYASDDGGSVMSRSRPGEGNNLFGGRQKVYRLATGGGSGQGRHLYDDDVNLSPYQQWRAAKSREEVAKPDTESHSESAPRDSEEADQIQSPITAFSKNRGTTSSTTSGPSNRRTSTAATSVATCESPIPRQNSGHGVASKMRSSDGYESNSVSRNPSSNSRKDFPLKDNVDQPPMPSASPLGHRLSQSRSAVNLKERYGAASPVFSSNAYRANSPLPAQGFPPLDSGIQESAKVTHMQSRRYQTASPTHQNFDDNGGSVYSNNIHANDRGKATAMGLFNRPRQQYDEQQFLQRQRQMHEGRISPQKSDTPERMVSPDVKSSAMGLQQNDLSTTSDKQPSERDEQEAMQTNEAHPASSRGMRQVISPAKNDDRDNAIPKPMSVPNKPAAGNVKARVESLIRRQNAELNALEVVRPPLSPPQGGRVISQGSQSSNKMPPSPFLNRFDSSDDETEVAQPPPARHSRPKIAPDEVHPALRNGTHDFDFGEQVSPRALTRHSEEAENTPSLHINPNAGPPSSQKPFEDDSPTLGPNGLGLSGMIRTHLRHDSDRSSFYPHSPTTSNFHRSRTSREMSMVSTSNTINPPESVHSDPWEFDNAQRNQHVSPRKTSEPSEPVALTMSQKAQQILGHAATQRAQAGPSSKAQRILGHEAPNSSAESILSPRWPPNSNFDANSSNETVESRPWRDDQYAHQRNPSTDTQKEQQDFDAELAERRRRIQEGLKGISEQERVMSPGPGRRSNEQHTQPTPGLRHKSSKGAMGGEYSTKAMKMLGLNGGQPPPEHHRPPPRHYNSSDNEYDEPPRERQWGRGPGHRPPPAPSQGYNGSGRRTPHEGYANGRRTPGDGRITPYGNSSNEDFERARQRSATPNSSRGYGRDRAGSEAAERSKSRTRHYRDDEGYGPPPQMRQGTSPSPPQGEYRRSPEESRHGPGYERSPSAMSGGRARSNSRPGPPPQGYFDARGAPPTPTMNGPGPTVGTSPVREREPMAPHPMNSGPGGASPAVGAPRPSPRPPPVVGLPASPMPSPFPASPAFPQASSSAQPVNGRTTPSVDSGRTTPGGNRRRMTVNKNMISEPTLVSSTSSIPLVGLPNSHPAPPANNSTPNLGRSETPPLPAMNPRRRGGGADSPAPASLVAPMAPYGGSHSAQPSPSFGMPAHFAPSGALDPGFGQSSPVPKGPPPRSRNRLRKTSSEGGNMASKARQQALAAEMRGEQSRTPTMAAFQFQQGGFARSQTSLGMSDRDGGMF